MYQAICSAQREILLEMYWFGSDKTGERFARALEERARAGVKVCVIYDAVGSWESDSAQFTRMREAGCDVHEYNPVRRWLFRLGAGNRRDHRKLLV
ncbi:MAG TPA: phospholipase D-like domain-containing protein, partial [Polyangiales bacterium]|nr:phospholipase D-like domain-containing protein [Polyangiales bacterium]